jgi:cytochrome b
VAKIKLTTTTAPLEYCFKGHSNTIASSHNKERNDCFEFHNSNIERHTHVTLYDAITISSAVHIPGRNHMVVGLQLPVQPVPITT